MSFTILETFLAILLIALIVTVIFRRLHLPVILGYILVGILVGPHALQWLPNISKINTLADFGVALLMFTVGLEFSLPKIIQLKRSVFLVGFAQVVFSILFTLLISWFLNIPVISAIIIGSIIAMSSTAIVLKQLTDQKELNTKHGEHALGVLLFQDLAVIPILVFVAALGIGSAHQQAFWTTFSLSIAKGILAVIFILVIGQWVLRPAFKLIEKTKQIELFTLAVLFVSLGSSWLTHTLGLSYALGAFVAGMMLAECEHKNQITLEIRPFRDILLALFFISIGMLVNINVLHDIWFWVLLMVIGLMLGKMALIITISLLARFDLSTAARAALVLSQGSEFGFAILTVSLKRHLIPADWVQSILAGLLFSFLCSPLLIRHNKPIVEKCMRLFR